MTHQGVWLLSIMLLILSRLSPSSEAKLQLLYKRNVRTSNDPYKRAVYCMLARCDINENHSNVLIKTEDYMWLKVSYAYMYTCIYSTIGSVGASKAFEF